MSGWKMVAKIIDIKGNNYIVNKEVAMLEPIATFLSKNKSNKDVFKWIALAHYLYYPKSDENPFWNIREHIKETYIKEKLGIKSSKEPTGFSDVKKFVEEIYETPTIRVFKSHKILIDKMADYINSIKLDDKTFKNSITYLKEFETIRDSYKKILKDVEEEMNVKVRGNIKTAYDQ